MCGECQPDGGEDWSVCLLCGCNAANLFKPSLGRTYLMLMLLEWAGGSWILEQPSSSLMMSHPAAVQSVGRHGSCFKINTFLGAYRHWSWKLTSFWSNKCLAADMKDRIVA